MSIVIKGTVMPVYMPLDGYCSYGQMEGKDADEEEKN